MPRRRINRKPRRKARKARKSRVPRSLNPQNQFATSLETVSLATLTDNSLYQHSFNLGQFPRSSAIGACYKFCRPVEVVWEYSPLYNTFQESSTGSSGVTVPIFYSYMNRTGNMTAPTVPEQQREWIQSTGARPKQFTKKIVIKYKPNWLSSGLLTYANAEGTENVNRLISMGSKAEFGWVPCPDHIPQAVTEDGAYALEVPHQAYKPDTVPGDLSGLSGINPVGVSTNGINYQGHYTFIRQAVQGSTIAVAELRMTVKWEFKNPNPQYYLLQVRDPESLAKLIV